MSWLDFRQTDNVNRVIDSVSDRILSKFARLMDTTMYYGTAGSSSACLVQIKSPSCR